MDKTGAGSGYVFPMPTALLFPPSPPSPLAPYYYYNSSPSSSSPASLTSASRHHVSLEITSLPILVLTVLGILTISAILLTYYVFVIRCCLSWHTTSSPDYGSRLIISLSRRRGRSTTSGHELPVVHGPAPDEARGGLGELAIRALPAFMYSKAVKTDDAGGGGDTSDCAVCLGEFQEEERVRLLPSCLHVFHADCVDTWLQGNANCPLCRAAITATTITSTSRELPVMGQLPRPDEEVAIQVLALTLAGPGGEDTQSHQQEADMAASKNSTHFLGDSSNSSSSDAHCMASEVFQVPALTWYSKSCSVQHSFRA